MIRFLMNFFAGLVNLVKSNLILPFNFILVIGIFIVGLLFLIIFQVWLVKKFIVSIFTSVKRSPIE